LNKTIGQTIVDKVFRKTTLLEFGIKEFNAEEIKQLLIRLKNDKSLMRKW